MAAPVTIVFEQRGDPVPDAPVSAALLAPRGTGGTIDLTTLTSLNADNAGTLGSDGLLKLSYDKLSMFENPALFALPYVVDSTTPANTAANIAACVARLSNPTEKAKNGGFPVDFVVFPEVGNDSNDANGSLSALSAAVNASLSRIAAGFCDTRKSASRADLVAWSGNNTADGLMAISNYDGATPGSIVAAEHWIRYIAAQGLGVNPVGARYSSRASNPTPEWVLDIEDANADAEVLDDHYMTSIVSYAGRRILHGGHMRTAVTGSPFTTIANRLVAFRFARRAAMKAYEYNGQAADGGHQVSLQADISDIASEYVDVGQMASADVALPQLVTGNRWRVPVRVFFSRFVDGVDLIVDVRNVA